jgi:phytoene synthase
MVGAELADPERSLALNYVPIPHRLAMLALWQLDEALGRIVASTTEPMIGQMRLTWWYERLVGLDVGERAAEPLLGKLAEDVLGRVTGADLAELIDGWEVVLDPLPLSGAVLDTFAQKRGGVLFRLSAKLLGVEGDVAGGELWALTDFATHCSDRVTADRAVAMALGCPRADRRTPKPLRILGRFARAKLVRPATPVGKPLSRFDFLRAVLG